MQKPVVDLLTALPVAAVEAGLILLACLLPALERWGAREPRKPWPNRAFTSGLVGAALLPDVGAYASFRAHLPITTVTQCLTALLPNLVLAVGIVMSLKDRILRIRRDRRDGSRKAMRKSMSGS
ncbi:hypothetical protein ACIPYS_05750 [Kitasatospora sp. NPDC089913]|uniref:hypothetical protein n=1 Tax=Kitasatospora sp. NPDC089913 TaxID=3364080 RepID=UPI0037F5FFD1